MKTTAIHIHAHGGPEVLSLASVEVRGPSQPSLVPSGAKVCVFGMTPKKTYNEKGQI
jgi:hypothetical protein